MHITQGPLTTSDHILPIICTLELTPTQIPCLPRPNFKRANWENFQKEIKETFNNPELTEDPTLEDIDDYIEHWYNTINNCINNNIPLTTHTKEKKNAPRKSVTNVENYRINNLLNNKQMKAENAQLMNVNKLINN